MLFSAKTHHVHGSQQKVVVVSTPQMTSSTSSSSSSNIIHRPYPSSAQNSPRISTHAQSPFFSPRRDSRDVTAVAGPPPPAHTQTLVYPHQQPQLYSQHQPHITQITQTARGGLPSAQYPRTAGTPPTGTGQPPPPQAHHHQHQHQPKSLTMTSQYPKPVSVHTSGGVAGSHYGKAVAPTAHLSSSGQYQRGGASSSSSGMKLLDHIVSLTTTPSSMSSQQGSLHCRQKITLG